MKQTIFLLLIPTLFFLSFQKEENKSTLFFETTMVTVLDGIQEVLPNAKAKVYEGIDFIETIEADEVGRIQINFDNNSDFHIIFECEGYHPKTILVTTRNIPKKMVKAGFDHTGSKTALKLITEENPTPEKSGPVVELFFDPEIEAFTHKKL